MVGELPDTERGTSCLGSIPAVGINTLELELDQCDTRFGIEFLPEVCWAFR